MTELFNSQGISWSLTKYYHITSTYIYLYAILILKKNNDLVGVDIG